MEQVQSEAERLHLDVLGLAETRWPGIGEYSCDGWTLYYSGGKQHQHGVGFLVSPMTARAITAVTPISERIMMIRINAKPSPVNIIQVYFPTTDANDDEVISMYKKVQDLVDGCAKKERLLVIGDFNAKIGENTCRQSCGKFGLGETNERGLRLLDWLEDNRMIAVNTCFRHSFKQKYTWSSPGDKYYNQIDFIAIRKRNWRECIDSRALPSADCGSDHQLVWARIVGRSWSSKPKTAGRKKRMLSCAMKNQEDFENSVKTYMDGRDCTWDELAGALKGAMEEHCPIDRVKRKLWMNEKCLDLIEERRKAKVNGPSERYVEMCKEG